MSTTVSSPTQAPQVAPNSTKSVEVKKDAAPPKESPPAAAGVKVIISPAAQAAQEAAETPAQTAQEARGSDQQAKRLLAKEQAAIRAYSGA